MGGSTERESQNMGHIEGCAQGVAIGLAPIARAPWGLVVGLVQGLMPQARLGRKAACARAAPGAAEDARSGSELRCATP